MTIKSTPSQLTVAAQVTTGELYVVMPDIEALSAFLGRVLQLHLEMPILFQGCNAG